MAAYFLSDLHLKTMKERNSQKLLRFLLELNSQPAGTLALLGDIFDVWVGPHRYFARRFQPLIDALISLKMSGWQLLYFEGNHDVHIDGFFQKIGFEVFTSAKILELEGLNVRLEHGDQMNLADTAYLAYREKIRTPRIRRWALLIPGFVWQWVASRASARSRDRHGPMTPEQDQAMIKVIRDHAQRVYISNPFDLIISGHMHVKDEHRFANFTSINLGSWFVAEPEVLKLQDKLTSWIKV